MLSINKVREIARISSITNFSHRKIANVLGCSHQSVGRYLKKLNRTGLTCESMVEMDDDRITSIINENRASLVTKKREPDYSVIAESMRKTKGLTLYPLWLEYISVDPKTAYKKSRFYQGYRDFCASQKLSMKQSYEPGEVAFIDYAGTKVHIWGRSPGEEFDASIFVGILGYSQLIFACATPKQTAQGWAQGIKSMFEYFGGVPATVVPDNAKGAILKPGLDFEVNPVVLALSQHYQTVVVPARVRRPQDKSLAEHAVKFIKQRILLPAKNMKFFSIDEFNAFLLDEVEKLNQALFQKRSTSRHEVFNQSEAARLHPLSAEPHDIVYEYYNRIVPAEYTIYIDEHFYSVPYELAHKKVRIELTLQKVNVYYNGLLACSHNRVGKAGEQTMLVEHMPPEHKAYANMTKEHFLKWAEEHGDNAVLIIEKQYSNDSYSALRKRTACLALQDTAKDLSAIEFNNLCQQAYSMEMTSPSDIKMLKAVMVAKAEREFAKPIISSHVRGRDYYQVGGA